MHVQATEDMAEFGDEEVTDEKDEAQVSQPPRSHEGAFSLTH